MERGALARLLLALAAVVAAADAQRAVGDACRGGAGECRSIGDCAEARAAIARRERPDICGYEGFTPIVCCSKAGSSTQPNTQPNTQPSSGASVAARMCTKYAEAVYKIERTFHLPPQRVRVDQCAGKGQPFIVGGVEAIANEFPHMALLGYGDNREQPEWGCGGSLISESFVLTAAHCIITKLGKPKIARLGELNLQSTDERNPHEDVEVAQSIPHPEYKEGVRYNDVGLLRLAKVVTFTASIRPACLHVQKEIGEKAIASGWGFIDWISNEISNHLNKVQLPIQKTERCSTAFKTLSTTFQLRRGILEESMVCAGGLKGKDTCQGDSGGPLQLKLEEPYCMYSIVGITSFGAKACGNTNSPAVYSRVSHFLPWIESIVWPS